VLPPMLNRFSTLILTVKFLKTPGPYLRFQTTTDKRKNFSKIYSQMGRRSHKCSTFKDYIFEGVPNYQLDRGAHMSRVVSF